MTIALTCFRARARRAEETGGIERIAYAALNCGGSRQAIEAYAPVIMSFICDTGHGHQHTPHGAHTHRERLNDGRWK